MRKLLGAMLLSTVCAAAQSVEGRIVNAATGDGIAGVRAEVYSSMDLNHPTYIALTDAAGEFRIEGVDPGKYVVRYDPPGAGFFSGGMPKPVEVTAGSRVKLLERFIPMGRVSGRVVDDRGKPVPKALVRIDGVARSRPVDADSQGRFDVRYALLPGGFTISAMPPAGFPPPQPEIERETPPASKTEKGGGALKVWTRTYYPGVATPEAAMRVVLTAGGELSDVELKLLAVPAHPVRGVLLDPNGKPAPGLAISLAGAPQSLTAESQPDGAFEFPAVADGAFYLTSEVATGGVTLRAREWMQIAGHAREGIRLQLNAPFTVRGKELVEIPEGQPAPNSGGPIFLAPVDRLIAPGDKPGFMRPNRVEGRPDENGNFSLENVYPGTYWLVIAAPPRGYYLDAIQVGGVAPLTPEVVLSSSAVSLTLVYKTNGGAVRGSVANCAAGWAVLIPQDPSMRWPESIRHAPCQAAGDAAGDGPAQYEMTAVRPGEYYGLALFGNANLPDSAPDWYSWAPDEGMLGQAGRVTVRAGETTSADLRLMAPPGN